VTSRLEGSATATDAVATSLIVEPGPGAPFLLLGTYDVAALGYLLEEFFISGEAERYTPAAPLPRDGRWSVKATERAPFKSRIVVVRPQDEARFNGTVLVEWLNVTGGLDAPADWLMAHREMVRSGYAYVAVSAQRIGIEGGLSRGPDMSLKKIAPERYHSLTHPGDAFAFDIFSQAGRKVRAAEPGDILGPLRAKHVIAIGESQSAMFLTTYVNAVDPLARVFDGFLVHSRFGAAASLQSRSIFGPPDPVMPRAPRFRGDLRVPLLNFITETDLIGANREGYAAARQLDNAKLRTWEVAGAAHTDNYTVKVAPIDTGAASIAELAAAFAPTCELMGEQLARPINFAPQHHYVLQAALSALQQWVASRSPAPSGERLRLAREAPPTLAVDGLGVAEGGVRTPWVDVPIARTSGVGGDDNSMAALFGSGELFDQATLDWIYPGGKAEYLRRFEASLDAAIEARFLLRADRAEILALASATYPGKA
jgi:hypothetical protein